MGGRAKREGADVSRVTDFVEQKELDSSRRPRRSRRSPPRTRRARRPRAERCEGRLAAVAIDTADVDMIVEQMELDRDRAERGARAQGDVVAALNALVTAA